MFDSPEPTPENYRKYEKNTGIPWIIDRNLSLKLTKKHGKFIGMLRGWWGQAATLEPPLVPFPIPAEMFLPTCDAFKKSKESDDITVLLTGRHLGLKPQILRILAEGKLLDDKFFFHCRGENGPKTSENKPPETFPWKIWMIEQYREIYSPETVEIWEDKADYAQRFREFNGNFLVNLVK